MIPDTIITYLTAARIFYVLHIEERREGWSTQPAPPAYLAHHQLTHLFSPRDPCSLDMYLTLSRLASRYVLLYPSIMHNLTHLHLILTNNELQSLAQDEGQAVNAPIIAWACVVLGAVSLLLLFGKVPSAKKIPATSQAPSISFKKSRLRNPIVFVTLALIAGMSVAKISTTDSDSQVCLLFVVIRSRYPYSTNRLRL